MNVNHEPGFLLADFCKATGRTNEKGNAVFDDETDVEPFLVWVLFNNADAWAYLKEYHETDDRGLIEVGLSEYWGAA